LEYQLAQEAAERLGVSVRAIQEWAKEGKIPNAKKQGRDWLIPANAQIYTRRQTLGELHKRYLRIRRQTIRRLRLLQSFQNRKRKRFNR